MERSIYVITGAGSGMGFASAQCLAAEASVLLLCDRNEDSLTHSKTELQRFGACVETCLFDVSDLDSVKACARRAASLGNIHAVIHAAGVTPANSTPEDILKTNGLGPRNIVKAFYPQMSEGGVMLLFGSNAAYNFDTIPQMAPLVPKLNELYLHWDDPDFLSQMQSFLSNDMNLPVGRAQGGMAYCLTKNFVSYFVKMNTRRFAAKGCRILSISPGSYLTPMHQAYIDNEAEGAKADLESIPLGRLGHPYEMGELVKFLCSPGAGYLTGVDILADGGKLSSSFPSIP